jgi:hypothetical protein
MLDFFDLSGRHISVGQYNTILQFFPINVTGTGGFCVLV